MEVISCHFSYLMVFTTEELGKVLLSCFSHSIEFVLR